VWKVDRCQVGADTPRKQQGYAAHMVRGLFAIALLGACSSSARNVAEVATPPASASAPGAAPAAAAALDPPKPVLRLPRNFLPTGYRVRLVLDPARPGFHGEITIDGELRERSKVLWLHGRGLKVATARVVSGDKVRRVDVAPVGEDLLSLRPAEPLDAGHHALTIEYDGAFDGVEPVGIYKRTFEENAYIATQFESIYARRAFPCFDEPDNKVPWQLTLDVPEALLAVANTPVVAEHAVGNGTKRVAFAPSKPLPSYLVAFSVGPYELVDAGKTRSGTPMRIVAVKGRAKDAQWAAETTPRIVQLLEDYFGTPYPYEKLDQLSQPVLLGGAMENPGLVIYAKGIILHDPARITQSQRLDWVDIAAHELAHQWFGDLVTTAWWDDIWLNEGFANWVEAKIVTEFDPAWRFGLNQGANRDGALQADSVATARRVRQPIANAGDIFQAFDSITYDKGQSVLAMFEHAIGPERFRDGVRAHLARHRFGNATSADFLAAISEVAGHDVAPAFSGFLDQTGAPMVRAELRCEPGRPPTVQLAQRRFVLPGSPPVPQGTTWKFPVCIAFDRGGARGEVCSEMTAATAEVALDTKACPAWIFPNAGGLGYYRTSQPEAALVALRDRGWSVLTPVERMAVYQDISASTLTGEVGIDLELSFVTRLMAEKHRHAVRAAVDVAWHATDLVDPAKLPLVRAWIRATFGPAARALSWQPRPRDDIDAEQERGALVSLVAWSGDPVLRGAAVKLARDWRTLPSSTRRRVLEVAADADRGTFDRLLAAAPVEKDPELRADLLRGLAGVSDESRLRKVLELLWDQRIEPTEARRFVYAGRTHALRKVTEVYVRDHLKQLFERFPDNGDEGAANLAWAFFGGCDASRRDEVAAFVTQAFGHFIGAERVIAQGLEELDQCIAIRRLLGPRLETWLTKR
jgi:cytosol alanyl aminopeptidase